MEEHLDGGEAVLEAFRRLSVEHVFSSPGSEWAPVWEALARQRRDHLEGPRYHDLTHETLAVGMAIGYTLITRRMQAVLLHTVPGLLQGAVAVHGALLQGVPMLVASSESITYGEGDEVDPGSQWYRNLSFVGGPHIVATPFVKWASQAGSVDVLYEMVLRAGELAQRAPQGPTYLNVPLESLLSPWRRPAIPKAASAPGARVSPSQEIEALAERLRGAERPIVLTESAGRDPAAFDALVELCEELAIPVLEPQATVCTSFPRDHMLHIGSDTALCAEADVILFVRCRAPWYPPSASPAPGAHVAVLDEVPHRPHMVYQVLQADQYLEGDLAATLTALRKAVAELGVGSSVVEARRAEHQARHEEQRSRLDAEEAKAEDAGDRVSAVLLAKVLREEAGEEAIFVDETITHSRVLQAHLRRNRPDGWLYVQGGLGQGFGLALGVKLATAERPVVFAVGDGSFLYNPAVQGLMASNNLELPLLIVIFNNRQYLSMKLNHLRFYPEGAAVEEDDFDGVDLSGQPRLSELGQLFGMPGWEVSSPAELRPAIREALEEVADGRTAIVNVALAR